MTLPSLFISHGSPMFAVEPGVLGPKLNALGQRLPRPRAVLTLSPHWMTRGLAVGSARTLETIHDFGGFPRVLYELDYPAPGAPDLAAEVMSLLTQAGVRVTDDDTRGRDHGAWVPMMHLYPDASVPLIQLSQPSTPSPLALLELGRAVAPLRERGVLIIGSGSLTHNLYDMGIGPSGGAYARAFADWVAEKLAAADMAALLDYRSACPDARRAHPTDEHFLPLFFAMGAAGEDWTRVQRIEGGITNDVLSMDSFVFGERTESADASDDTSTNLSESKQ